MNLNEFGSKSFVFLLIDLKVKMSKFECKICKS